MHLLCIPELLKAVVGISAGVTSVVRMADYPSSFCIEETVVGWRDQLWMKTSELHYIQGVPICPSCSALAWYSCQSGLSP